MAQAPKSRAAAEAIWSAMADVENHLDRAVPDSLKPHAKRSDQSANGDAHAPMPKYLGAAPGSSDG